MHGMWPRWSILLLYGTSIGRILYSIPQSPIIYPTTNMTNPKNLTPSLKYHGGKHYLAKKIVSLMPPHKRYVETHFGGGAVLFAKNPEGVSEFANDLDGELINFWHTLRNPDSWALFQRAAECTPLSDVEFTLSKVSWHKDLPLVSKAWYFFVRNRQSRQGLGKDFCTPTSRTRRGMNENVSAWLSAIEGLPEVHARLRRVEIRNQDACDLIRELDSPDTLLYVDPPYLHETRVAKRQYQHEMTDHQHAQLLASLSATSGKFLLSGYRSTLYDAYALRNGWHRVDFQIDNKASGAKVKPIKTESLWANYEIQAN